MKRLCLITALLMISASARADDDEEVRPQYSLISTNPSLVDHILADPAPEPAVEPEPKTNTEQAVVKSAMVFKGTRWEMPAEKFFPPDRVYRSVGRRGYVVNANETFKGVADRAYGDRREWKRIYKANRRALPADKKLKLGQTLVLP